MSDARTENSSRPQRSRSSGTVGDLFRNLTEGRWKRPNLSSENILESIKTLAWVGPLTILIWVYAEREQISDPPPIINGVQVRFESTSTPRRYVEYSGLGGAASATVSLKLKGPQATLDKVRGTLTTSIPRGVVIEIGSSVSTGQNQPVDVISYIQNQPLFKDNGVTVMDCQPPKLLVDIAEIETRSLPVQSPADARNLTAATVFDPPTVTLTGPSTAFQQLEGVGKLNVIAEIGDLPILQIPGKHTLPSVPVSLAARESRIDVSPRRVQAVLDVRAADATFEIPAIPISVQAPVGTLSLFDVTLTGEQTIAKTHVIGPQSEINRLISKQFIPKAVLEVAGTDFNREEPRTLKYILPDGVHVAPEDASRSVEFKLTRRASPGG